MDIFSMIFFGAFAGLVVLDLVAPARRFPRIRGWRLIGLASFAVYVALAMHLPFLWDEHLAAYQLFDATGLGTPAGIIIGIVSLQLVSYVWHRLLHRSDFLWRWFHQVHHSAERIDIHGAFYFSPLDVAGFTLAASLSLVLIVGVTPEAAAIATIVVTLVVMLGHTNIRTPAWLGYVIQRPENHALHHQRGVHRYNYGDFSFVDMLFGTFRNPASWEHEAGFHDGSHRRLGAMLLGRDIAAEHASRDTRPDARQMPASPEPTRDAA